MDISIAVPNPCHGDPPSSLQSSTSAAPLVGVSASRNQCSTFSLPQGFDTGQTLVHARLDARDVRDASLPMLPSAMTCSSAAPLSQNGVAPDESNPPSRASLKSPGAANGAASDNASDVERFDGKIVYNPDGSAYIIEEGSEVSEEDDTQALPLPRLEGAIVDDRKAAASHDSQDLAALPQIASAFFVSRQNLFNALYGQSLMRSRNPAEMPVMHSFRVYSVRGSANKNSTGKEAHKQETDVPMVDYSTVPIKPILMCFVCKLSFGFAKSFVAHAMSEHNLELETEEKDILQQQNTSAFLQYVGKSKVPVVSFLEPVGATVPSQTTPQKELRDQDTRKRDDLNLPSEKSPMRGNSISPLSSSSAPSPATSISPVSAAALASGMGAAGPALVCPDHPTGRPAGVECPRCDLAAANSRGPLALMATRNSCKTLKCPKCNWHYKYQETLEIHMKEKHPENETSCIYCLTNQPHPRLARGETYTCGYKPYRCEVCNYSTTTKGNLSIHMQSDKHLNNAQELQNGGLVTTPDHNSLSQTHKSQMQTSTPQQLNMTTSPSIGAAVSAAAHNNSNSASAGSSGSSSVRPKPTWRCDVCNYETNVARNLRIHMTSEKHTHNMVMLQQNVKRMQQFSALQAQSAGMPFDPASMLSFHVNMENKNAAAAASAIPEAALADMAYNQALFIQMMTGGHIPSAGGPDPGALSAPWQGGDVGLNPETMEPPPEPVEMDPSHVFQCLVCGIFNADGAESLAHHVSADRSRQREHEALLLIGGHYMCRLCAYKTTLKANFQLHCKTDKHLQRLQHATHIQEGGPRNEWKLQYVNSTTNPVQLRCNVCEYYTNSVHKMQVHATSPRHEVAVALFRHLTSLASSSGATYKCQLCQLQCPGKLTMLQHARSLRHCQMEQLAELQRRAAVGGQDVPPLDLRDVFVVVESADAENSSQLEPQPDKDSQRGASIEPRALSHDVQHGETPRKNSLHNLRCTECSFVAENSETLRIHVESVHNSNQSENELCCPLCQSKFKNRSDIEMHAVQVHNVNAEGLQRLLLLVEQANWLTATIQQQQQQQQVESEESGEPVSKQIRQSLPAEKVSEKEDSEAGSGTDDLADSEELRCSNCQACFRTLDALYSHQNELNHFEIKQTPNGPGYLCWKKGCNQYFPSVASLQMHFREIHARIPAVATVSERHAYKYRCPQCSLAFKTLEKLQLHSQYHMIRDATKCPLCGRSFRSILSLQKHLETTHAELTDEEAIILRQSLLSHPLLLSGLAGQASETAIAEYLRREQSREEHETDDGDKQTAEDEEMTESKAMSLSAEKEDAMDAEDADLDADGNNTDSAMKEAGGTPLEDYLNSQNVAEETYNDPNRKYKCHRCKMAFTNQNYLTSHNKTMLHRKGEKLHYPVEKYLDPNRPFKCEVCRESFTQKNILLVHYNSVSHLHKLKRAMQEQQQSTNVNGGSSTGSAEQSPLASSSKLDKPPVAAATPSSKSENKDDSKPWKCNICKVAYTQGSTLDIHLRSVLHQTRAAKLQELAAAGQIDLTRPLIEQPDISKQNSALEGQRRNASDMGGSRPSSTVPSSEESGKNLPSSTLEADQLSAALSQLYGTNVLLCSRCGSLCLSQEQLLQHQQYYCPLQSGGSSGPFFSAENWAAQLSKVSAGDVQSRPDSPIEDSLGGKSMPRRSSRMLRHLLGSYGFELVMQFNECHQRQRGGKRERNREEINEGAETAEEENKENSTIAGLNDTEKLPEMQRCVCPLCNKSFSSIWVLKAHSEEIHKQMVPPHFLEKCAEEIKNDYNKRLVNQTVPQPPASPVERLPPPGNIDRDREEEPAQSKETVRRTPSAQSVPAASLTNGDVAPNLPPPVTPTPTAPSTPASSADSAAASAASNVPLAIAQQMNEMQAALNAVGFASQMQFNPMMMGLAGLGMGLPMGFNMPAAALAAMNMQPPLVPLMMGGSYDSLHSTLAAQSQMQNQFLSAAMDPALLSKQHLMQQQQQQQQQHQQQAAASVAAAAAAATAQQKRARTRISDDQLKILRAHFDINNSPSEEQIQDMARQSGLPPKVIKHWFRNTLFKERQRNKDSPYNFNNPPSTTLNLEEYEKTGEAKVIPLKEEEKQEIQAVLVRDKARNTSTPKPSEKNFDSSSIKKETEEQSIQDERAENKEEELSSRYARSTPTASYLYEQKTPTPVPASLQISNLVAPGPISSPSNLSLNSMMASQLNVDVKPQPMLPPRPSTSTPSTSLPSPALAALSPGRSEASFTLFANATLPMPPLTPPGFSMAGSPACGSSGPGSATGKRANRTRFTDYQIKVLQEFFENNAYPKDDDLEYLSKLLNLSPRVIVVWFQNARQKARKVYENQPAVETTDDGSGRFQRTPGLNYQCKKCLLVFQRYYELIRHQKTHCFKEEDAKRSAVAQAAAAQAAATFSSSEENSNSSSVTDASALSAVAGTTLSGSMSAAVSLPAVQHVKTPEISTSSSAKKAETNDVSVKREAAHPNKPEPQNDSSFHCEQCGLTFVRFDLWREHQIVHLMNPELFGKIGTDPQLAALLQQQAQLAASLSLNANFKPNLPVSSSGSASSQLSLKRRLEEENDDDREDQPRDKRLRTTILPEQLDYLYQQYQLESNPSRKMLETISREVGLKKRVVQVWFQNTRARERKGQFRAHIQVINKRCPFCPALFKVKSALESHLSTRHPDQYAKGEINIDAIPDEDPSLTSPLNANASTSAVDPGSASATDSLTKRLSMNYQQSIASLSMLSSLYQQGFVAPMLGFDGKAEEALKRYANDYLASSSTRESSPAPAAADLSSKQGNPASATTPAPSSRPEGPFELPLDLSKPLRPESAMHSECTDDARSEHFMDYYEHDESNPSSPVPSASFTKLGHPGSSGGGGNGSSGSSGTPGKRFRTQMSAVQVRVMKSLFNDYKTPTMAECEALGREIGLPKRVVQVWFQNARAKEKKSKLNQQKAGGAESESSAKQPEACFLCDFKYSHKYAVQDHIFTHQHIERVKQHVAEQCAKGADDTKSSTGLQNNSREDSASSSPTSTVPPAGESGANAEALEALLLHQLYGLGYAGMPAAALAAATYNQSSISGQMPFWGQGNESYFLAMLQRSPAALTQIAATFQEPGASEARFTLDGSSWNHVEETISSADLEQVRQTPQDVGVLCKACQMLYPNEAAIVQHQQSGCPAAQQEGIKGYTRLILTQYECSSCEERFLTLGDLRSHCAGHQHRKEDVKQQERVREQQQQQPAGGSSPSSSPGGALSSQIEDVVKQLTALAQASSGQPLPPVTKMETNKPTDCDTNANIAQNAFGH